MPTQAKVLKHDEIVRFNRMADKVSNRTRTRLEFLKMRTTELDGLTAHRSAFNGLGNQVQNVLLQPVTEPDATKRTALELARATAMDEMCSLVERARRKEPEAITELDALWTRTVDLYVRAKNNFIMFFEPINLQPDEQVRYMNTFKTPVDVGYISQDGRARTRKAVASRSFTYFDLRSLETDEVEYPLEDINLGPDIAEMAQATVDLAWDMDAQINALAKTMFLTLLGAFTTTGAKLDRTYVKGGHIEEANLPTTNDIILAGNSPTTKVRVAAIKAIMNYYDSWGDMWGEKLSPTGIIMIPSSGTTDLADEFTPTGSSSNPTSDGIIKNYSSFEWFDKKWTLVPDVTLAPGYIFPMPSKPVGQVFFKPWWDRNFVERNERANWEKRSLRKGIQFASPKPDRVNALRIKYRD